MATGDIKGVLRKLEQRLRIITYPRDVDYSSLVKGDPSATLPIISYTFTGYSTHIAEILVSLDVELSAKSDLRFIDAVYKVLRDVFQYKPILTKQQFLQCAFSERKIQTVCDIIDCVVKKHKEITNQTKVKFQPPKKWATAKDRFEVFYPEESSVQPTTEKLVQNKMLVERHIGRGTANLPIVPERFVSSTQEEISSSESEGDGQCEDVVTKDAEIDLLKAQLAECQEKLTRLDWMEERLQTLENSMKGKLVIDESDWNNLLSRVLLLETDRLIHSKKKDLTAEFTSISEECTSSRITNAISPDFHTKVVIPESNHQSSGYNSLLSADTSPITNDINYSCLTEDLKEPTKQRIDRLAKMLEETSNLLKYSNTS
ncbi:centrosomal protein of 44 kDa [Rana temporaria]|uniref:centrosomal protein of 44 kDa n=1 Tax=Rana temporaria TaxID=8407 RepID=UPI001AACC59D|nr:centrosomal protein of 44 kDa [Rana temporaria]XP_040189451.1 centrosomal protein of 44 kDa [Rana temporaria]XP_040189462.1 centrosomal protein of 44 kDa [Rana temporaria]XP_040189473.1 centrosomal protein of 44 kDa [Rana temporaria]